MSTLITLTANASAAIKYDSPNENFSSAAQESLGPRDALLVSFPSPASTYRRKKILSADLYVHTDSPYDAPNVRFLSETFSASSVTYNTRPKTGTGREALSDGEWHHADIKWYLGGLPGIEISHVYSQPMLIDTSRSSDAPYIELLIDETVTVGPEVTGAQPASGYVPRAQANTFRWSVIPSAPRWNAITQASAVFTWRAAGSSTVHDTSLTTEQTVTVPADTFPAGGIEWRVKVTDANGSTYTSPWYSLDTDEALPTATPLEPVNTIADGTADATFCWAFSVATGTAQSAAELQLSADGDTWTALGSVSGSDTSLLVAAGSLGAGTRFWRVRAANSEGSYGAWSDPAQIIVVAGPVPPAVSATEVPFSTVSWQADGQTAWELSLDGEKIAGAWGGASSHSLTEPLQDGRHVFAVRVQNVYGLWCEWSETVVNIANVPGSAIALSASGGEHYVTLTIGASGYPTVRILRDGAAIGETSGGSYADDTAPNGVHSYQALGILANGNYTLSNTAEAEAVVRSVMLKDAAAGYWLELPTAKASETAISVNYALDLQAVHYAGRRLPTAEIGESGGRTVQLRPTFARSEAGEKLAALAALLRRRLFYKDPQGRAFPAVISSLQSSDDRGIVSCSLSILETDGGESYA